ncbi:DUF58 domain-containing protein [Sulfuricystis multivorans]|uniref:DUF58 domain-containing protein n=1 Tax=Sulfuricystis multivorans TaxID=2211108 RepID=UPI000F82110F|nr:DUF58 domain-containing protein [Sulfuricystis multivorans]
MLSGLRLALRERFIAWALRAHPPEAQPVMLGQRRVYVLPTRAGLLYAISLIVLLIGAINYNLSLGYALVFLLAGVGVVTILHTFRNLAGIALGVAEAAPVFVGCDACFPLLLHNPDARARRRLRLFLPGQAAVAIDLPPQESTRALLPLPARRRGWLTMPRVTIDTVWPLGLVRCWAYAWPAARCLVYPRPARAVPKPPSFAAMQEGRLASEAGDEDFAGLKRHRPGDPLHHVAWKIAARLGPEASLQTKQFSGTASPALMFDWAQLPGSLDVETRLSILARWVLDAEEAGLSYGLRLPGREISQTQGPVHLHACLKALALYGDEA